MKDWQGHWPQAAQMYALLGIVEKGQTIPPTMTGTFHANINGFVYRFRLYPSRAGLTPTRRLFVACPDCGALVEFGHFHQHRHAKACCEGLTLRRTVKAFNRETFGQ